LHVTDVGKAKSNNISKLINNKTWEIIKFNLKINKWVRKRAE